MTAYQSFFKVDPNNKSELVAAVKFMRETTGADFKTARNTILWCQGNVSNAKYYLMNHGFAVCVRFPKCHHCRKDLTTNDIFCSSDCAANFEGRK